MGIIEGASTYLISVFAGDIQAITGAMANDISGFGIFAIPVMILALGLLGIGIYLILDFARMTEDFS